MKLASTLGYLPVYLAAIGLAAVLWTRPILLTAIYVALSAALLSRWHTKGDLAFYFVPLVLGPAGELLPILGGAWSYSRPQALIPLWLPFAWGMAGLFMKKTAEGLLAEEGEAS